MFRLPCHWLSGFRRHRWVLLATLALTGCALNKNAPGRFFEGQYLEVAWAVESGNLDQLPRLVGDLDINVPGRKGMTLLWFAIQERSFEAIRLLVEMGAKPDENIAKGIGSGFDYAIYSEARRFLAAMLDGGMPPN